MSSLALRHLDACPLEPIQQLAPYLSGLDVSEALDGFTKLADKILMAGEQPGEPDDSFHLQVDSPGGLSCSSSQWLSPASSGTSSSCSSGANSPAPSWQSCSSYSSSSSGCGRRARGERAPTESRRRNNATAAERYRQKLKGRKRGLGEQLTEQLERNQRLRRQLEAKLSLYKEFAALLARQTAADDRELASLGCRSLGLVLAELASPPGLLDLEQRRELLDHLRHFQSVLCRVAPPTGQPNEAKQNYHDEDDDDMIEYDFFADRFSLVGRRQP